MRISKVEFENFRNFKDHGVILFPTDGQVTVIYGTNGVGKTTFHQLFQWIIYGAVHFNKTASNKMYNLERENELPYGERMSVSGTIDFEHPSSTGEIEQYSLRREWIYRKELEASKKIGESFHLLKKINDDWKKINDDPNTVIEHILPSGLAQYFFFDGESMVAELREKGKDSARSLRKALYSIFDLDVYREAAMHIGTKSSGSSTVLGKLYLSRSENSTNTDVIVARGNLHQTQKKIEALSDRTRTAKDKINELSQKIQELSELIGGSQSQDELNEKRQKAKRSIQVFEDAIKNEEKSFGKDIMICYPYLLLSKMVEEAQYRIGLKVEEESLLPGLKKELLLSLLQEDICVCGRHLGETEKATLESLLKLFPPLSYKYIYDQFKSSAARYSTTYDAERLPKHLTEIFKYQKQIASLRKEIRDIDEEQSQSANVDNYITQRREAESSLDYWKKEQSKVDSELGLQGQYLKQRMKKYDDLVSANRSNSETDQKIEVIEAVLEYFENLLHDSADEYSRQLRDSIQELLNTMLTSTRTVEMTSQFELSVKDSYGDEAKSEGQFAVVSFAYIGGIFKLLSEVPTLKGKEFPLVLDGPFSKLDIIQRQNVIDTIPSYAPQVILFSKDDITACFPDDIKDNIWTIYSNRERNVSRIKRGYDPEVFKADATDQ